MTKLEELQDKPREERTSLEQCIVDAAKLEDMRDGDTELMEKAIAEHTALLAIRLAVQDFMLRQLAKPEFFSLDDVEEKFPAFAKALSDYGELFGWTKP